MVLGVAVRAGIRSGRRERVARVAVGLLVAFATLVAGAASPAVAQTISYPDIRVKVPVAEISIGTISGTKYLEFSHVTWNAGAGPLEIRPSYDAARGTAQMVQALYSSNGAGGWSFATTVPIVKQPVFVSPSDYRFPMSQFGVYAVAPGGGVGALVRPSPKVDFCMTPDLYVGGIPYTPNQSAYSPSNCSSPNGTLGLDVGWGDKYDSTDAGENIDISTVADGVYWLRAIADPFHYFRDSNPSDNVTDTKIRITGTTVTVLQQLAPALTPPSIAMTAPTSGSTASGSVTVSANVTGPVPIASVQFLLDGQPLGAADTTSPYSVSWTVGSATPSTHWLSAQARDGRGLFRTAVPVPVTVPRHIGTLNVVLDARAVGNGSVTTNGFAVSAGEELLALVGSDGQGQTVSVGGAALTWTRVRRNNAQAGDVEIWVARAGAPASGLHVTSTPALAGFDQQLVVLGITGATGIGASAVAAAASGAPAITITTTASGSASFAVGNDFDHATARTMSAGQTMWAQYVDGGTGDTYWVQGPTNPSTSVGQHVAISDTAPTTDRWNLAAVEVVPVSASATTQPTVGLLAPASGQVVSGVTPVSTFPHDDVAVESVQLSLDGHAFGPALHAPYTYAWDTRAVANGMHHIDATVQSVSGARSTAPPVVVDVENPAPPMYCFIMDAVASVDGTGTLTSPAIHTGSGDETVLAFVAAKTAASGAGSPQGFTVAGGGLAWRLAARVRNGTADAEIWTASATAVVAGAAITATPAITGEQASLTVVAMQESAGVGTTATASGSTGAPSVSITTTGDHSLVLGVGVDVDRAELPDLAPNEQLHHAWVDTAAGATFWALGANMQAGPTASSVTLGTTAPTGDHWAAAAVELLGEAE